MTYIDVDDVKDAIVIDDTVDDPVIQRAIDAAGGAVEGFCRGRRFTLDAQDVARRFTAADTTCVELVPDLTSITTLETDTTGDGTYDQTWTAADYELAPLDADLDGRPFEQIIAVKTLRFPRGLGRVRVTGRFGWPAVPAEVPQAQLLVATRLLKRTKEAPFGIAPAQFEGAAVRLLARFDADGVVLLKHLRYAGTVG